MTSKRQLLKSEKGFIMPTILSFIIAIVIISGAAAEIILSNLQLVGRNVVSQKAFNISEAGVNYYLWHLSHSPADFKDGKTTPTTPDPTLGYGPYVHNYVNDNNVVEGTFTLWISPQSSGSTIAKIRSIGQVANSTITRTVDAQIGSPSFASYGVVSDTALWFGNTESATGPVHSNQGVRMDGTNSADVTSANSTYVPSSQLGGNGSTSHPGVWCDTSITTPINCNTRTKTDWRYPVPAVDFNQVTSSLCTIKKLAFKADATTTALAALANACTQTPTTRTAAYLPQRSSSGAYSLTKGYLIKLNTSGTYDLLNVDAENDRLTPYTSALTTTVVASGVTIPASGVIFAEDNVWVLSNPSYHGRVTIAAGRLATNNNAEIVIAGNIKYTTKDGSDAIGLISENSITVAPYAPPSTGAFNFEIDGALIAQTGSVTYPGTYRTSALRCTRGWINSDQTFTFYGSVASRQTWTWTWQTGGACGDAVNDPVNGYISGIEHNDSQYDYNLLYAPPPSYPTTSTYNVLSWREVLTKP
ncbi:MAG: hypothetical protein NTX80_03585 [Candidatus Saccharibacteria bacterium]|nr:hypothetical protein [Candidatus Saccharibacteria bacterium]